MQIMYLVMIKTIMTISIAVMLNMIMMVIIS